MYWSVWPQCFSRGSSMRQPQEWIRNPVLRRLGAVSSPWMNTSRCITQVYTVCARLTLQENCRPAKWQSCSRLLSYLQKPCIKWVLCVCVCVMTAGGGVGVSELRLLHPEPEWSEGYPMTMRGIFILAFLIMYLTFFFFFTPLLDRKVSYQSCALVSSSHYHHRSHGGFRTSF